MDEGNDKSVSKIEVLREIGTIGAGRAATALSELLRCKVDISLPEVQVLPLELLDKILGNPEDIYFVINVGLERDIQGRIFFLTSVEEARQLGASLLGKRSDEIDISHPLFISSLEEIFNILAGSYFCALSEMTGLTTRYEAPSLAVDMVAALLDFFFIEIAQKSEEAIFIKTKLIIKNIKFNGLILFFPDADSLQKVVDSFLL
jgi:chemotaxis protein CheC